MRGSTNDTQSGLACPQCKGHGSHVIDSRGLASGRSRRRRYECDHCKERFTTYEISTTEYEKIKAIKLITQLDATITALRAIKAQFGDANGHT